MRREEKRKDNLEERRENQSKVEKRIEEVATEENGRAEQNR